MQKSTIFGIKVTIGSTLLSWLAGIASYFVFSVFSVRYRELIYNGVFMGVFSMVISFAAVYITANTILNNTKPSKAETSAHLDRGWRVYGGTGLFFMVLYLAQTSWYVGTSTAFSLLSVASGCAAFFVLQERQ